MKEFVSGEIFGIIRSCSESLGVRSYVVGGYVRDSFLGLESKDIDVVVEGSGIALAEAVGKRIHARVSVFRTYGTAMLRFKGMEIEFVGARKTSYKHIAGEQIIEDGTLYEDQQRRDFTVNDMAISLTGEDFGTLIDPFGGIRDLDAGIIRTPVDPDTTFGDDPLRMLRAVRFAVKLSTPERKFSIAPDTLEAMGRAAETLKSVAGERILEELNKILLSPFPAMGLRIMQDTGILMQILPQLSRLETVEVQDGKGHKDNFAHTLEVLENVIHFEKEASLEPKLYLHWAALLHDIGKSVTKRFDPAVGWTFHGHEAVGAKMVDKVFRSLKMPLGEELKYVRKLVSLHMRPIALVDEVTDSAVRRLLFEAGEDIDDLMILCNADITSKNPRKVLMHRANFEKVKVKMTEVEKKDEIRNFKNPIDGNYIMELFGIEPGKDISVLKNAVKDAILDGVIPNEFSAADAFMREKAASIGLKPVE